MSERGGTARTVVDSETRSESDKLRDMLGGRHRFEFVGKEPLVLWVVVSLLFANTFLMLLLQFGAKYLLPIASLNLQPCEALGERGVQYHAPEIVCWYASRSIAIQFVLLAIIAAVFIIFRKRVRYIRRK
jgi:hypothetical protein